MSSAPDPLPAGSCRVDADCPDATWCSPVTSTCVPGCKADADCATGGATLACDLSAHRCVGCTETSPCPGAQICCGSACFDPSSDPLHCGSCAPCPTLSHAAAACSAGKCGLGACDPGYSDCDAVTATGCETNTDSEAENCGACGTVCSLASSSATCSKGACVVGACGTGRADCNAAAADGCEVDLRVDVAHCGDCATACPSKPGAETTCVSGACGVGACKAGFADCDADRANGCEDVLADAKNCGACGNACPSLPHSTPRCTAGACDVGVCDVGFADCDGELWNGCEVDLSTDAANCGTCKHACPSSPNAATSCNAGVCGAGACTTGFADCDASSATGCEVALSSNAAHCGICGNACPPLPHAAPSCASFACGLGACDAGYADCFGGAADGCETSLQTDADHCGGCATICPAVPNAARACNAGTCGRGACAAGFADCDGALANGCESKSATDAANCGSCGNPCAALPHASPACAGSACALGACAVGWSNCNGDPSDGCERDTSSDADNCGGCGIKCGSGTCVAAACVCSKQVLILKDDSDAGATTLATALTGAGYAPTVSTVRSYQYDGTNPSLAGFGAVILLAGGPTSTSFQIDMPAAGQTAIVNHVAAGNGLVLTEWAALHAANGRWTTLAPLVLLQRTVSYSGQVTATVDAARAAHPLWAGLPTTFTFAGVVNVGVVKPGADVSVLATSPQALDVVALRDGALGRVVHFAHAGNYAPNGWTNVNVQKLMSNAAGWAARCQ